MLGHHYLPDGESFGSVPPDPDFLKVALGEEQAEEVAEQSCFGVAREVAATTVQTSQVQAVKPPQLAAMLNSFGCGKVIWRASQLRAFRALQPRPVGMAYGGKHWVGFTLEGGYVTAPCLLSHVPAFTGGSIARPANCQPHLFLFP